MKNPVTGTSYLYSDTKYCRGFAPHPVPMSVILQWTTTASLHSAGWVHSRTATSGQFTSLLACLAITAIPVPGLNMSDRMQNAARLFREVRCRRKSMRRAPSSRAGGCCVYVHRNILLSNAEKKTESSPQEASLNKNSYEHDDS